MVILFLLLWLFTGIATLILLIFSIVQQLRNKPTKSLWIFTACTFVANIIFLAALAFSGQLTDINFNAAAIPSVPSIEESNSIDKAEYKEMI
ncbi:hypothetical protein ACFOLA_10785 [Salinicoccus hispanicus]|uniref:Uncharacterized protein n=1 Tax=Salinicoccus hispanicus TaxID=157225 RepID=A0A6N8TZY1_9STAP|nr:hypothetical protein [Salinicoccus hispanicus]MXQ51042.1 hypothetical protein [Salinicoccus hispanicus]